MNEQGFSRRDFLKATTGLGAAAVMPRHLRGRDNSAFRKPNIILIMADDLGYECIGVNGGTSYKTPELDKLAATGIRFEHCYSQPLCTPSRVQIMTGIYNVRNYVRFGELDRKETTFSHLLKANGYVTCVVGKWQLGREVDSPQHFGFDESCLWQHTRRPGRYPNPGLEINGRQVDYHNGEYGPDVVSEYACRFIERNRDKPFLLYYPMILTHCPFEPTPDSSDWNPKSKGSKTYKGNPKYFGDMVRYMDKIVGKLVVKLEELDLRGNTLLLFTGDNGTDEPVVSAMEGREVAGGKGHTTDAGTHVPLIANWPGVIPQRNVCRDLVDFSDFLPTLCECAAVRVPEKPKLDGRSFLGQLKGKKANRRDWIYCWYSRDGNAENAQEFARNQRYKLYRTGEFYDVNNDVLEKENLAVEIPDQQTRLIRSILQKALDQYKDARSLELLRGAKQRKSKNE
ncbi:MAG: sulfatase-like hydrolase/transferase [Planctomycetota bacterium]